jgi:hypothetical protein
LYRPPDDEQFTFSKQVEDNLSEINYKEKVCILLVFLTCYNYFFRATPQLVENVYMAVVTQPYFGKFLNINYMFWPLIEWAIIRLKQEITEKITLDNMNIHQVST